MRSLLLIAATSVLFLNSCDTAPSAPTVTVEDAWVRLPAVAGRPAAAYFTLKANGEGVRLLGVSSPSVGGIELHDSTMDHGMMKMGPLADNNLPASGPLKFEPGGKHAMLFDIDSGVTAGGTIPLTFTFDPAPAVSVEATVVGAGDPAPE